MVSPLVHDIRASSGLAVSSAFGPQDPDPHARFPSRVHICLILAVHRSSEFTLLPTCVRHPFCVSVPEICTHTPPPPPPPPPYPPPHPIPPSFGLAVYGLAETWRQAPDDLRSAWHGVLPLGDIAKLYAGARVVLGTTDRKQQKLGMINNRVFEALSCGATLIQDWFEALETKVNGRHRERDIVLFHRRPGDTAAHLHRLLQSGRAGEAELLRRGGAGRDWVLAGETWHHRSSAMLAALGHRPLPAVLAAHSAASVAAAVQTPARFAPRPASSGATITSPLNNSIVQVLFNAIAQGGVVEIPLDVVLHDFETPADGVWCVVWVDRNDTQACHGDTSVRSGVLSIPAALIPSRVAVTITLRAHFTLELVKTAEPMFIQLIAGSHTERTTTNNGVSSATDTVGGGAVGIIPDVETRQEGVTGGTVEANQSRHDDFGDLTPPPRHPRPPPPPPPTTTLTIGVVHYRPRSRTPLNIFEVGFTAALDLLKQRQLPRHRQRQRQRQRHQQHLPHDDGGPTASPPTTYRVDMINLDEFQGIRTESDAFQAALRRFDAADVLLVKSNWEWTVDEFVRTYLRNCSTPKALLISGVHPVPSNPAEVQFYDALVYETNWYRQRERLASRHSNIYHAFGVDTTVMRRLGAAGRPKIWDLLFVGWPVPGKRLERFVDRFNAMKEEWRRQSRTRSHSPGRAATATFPRALAVGRHPDETPESTAIVARLVAAGVEVRDVAPYKDLAALMNEAREVYIPSAVDGGGERAVLEARACGTPVRVEEDNPKLRELANSATQIYDHVYYADQLEKVIASCVSLSMSKSMSNSSDRSTASAVVRAAELRATAAGGATELARKAEATTAAGASNDNNACRLEVMVDDVVRRLVIPGSSSDAWRHAVQFCAHHNIGSDGVCIDQIYGAALARFDELRDAKRGESCRRRRLMVVAHPDDEVIWGAETLANSIAGDCWTVISATGGPDPEARAAFLAVGVRLQARLEDHIGGVGVDVRMTMRSYVDCLHCVPMDKQVTESAKQATMLYHDSLPTDMKKEIGRYDWHDIVTHGPLGEYGHPQHRETHAAVARSARELGMHHRLWYFRPRIMVDGTDGGGGSESGGSFWRGLRQELLGLYNPARIPQANIAYWVGIESGIQPADAYDAHSAQQWCQRNVPPAADAAFASHMDCATRATGGRRHAGNDDVLGQP